MKLFSLAGLLIILFGVGGFYYYKGQKEKDVLKAEKKYLKEITDSAEMLWKSEKKYRALFDNMLDGFTYCKILLDENNQPVDFVYLMVNDAYEKLIGLKKEHIIGKKATEVIPGTKEFHTDLLSIFGAIALTGKKVKFEFYYEPLNKWFYISTYSQEKEHFVVVYNDITRQKKVDKAFDVVVRGTVGTIGQDYFDNIVNALCEWLGTECAIIGQIVGENGVEALSMKVNEEYVNDYEYSLAGTPCNNVANKGFCVYPENICELFPEDKVLNELGAIGYVGIPLRNKSNETIGILCVISRNKLNLPEHTEEVMEIIAVRASAEIERMKDEEALKQKERESALLAEASGIFNSSLEIEEIFDEIAKLVSKEIGETCTIFNKKGEHLVPITSFNKGKEDEKRMKILTDNLGLLQRSIAAWCVENKEPIFIPDTSQDQRFIPFFRQTLPSYSYICIPLISKGEVQGILSTSIIGEGRQFCTNDLNMMVAIADRAAPAMENSNLYDEAITQSQRLSVVNEISKAVNSTLDLEKVYKTIIEQLKRVLPFPITMNIALYRPEDDMFVFSHIYDPSGALQEAIKINHPYSGDSLILAKAFKTRKPMYTRDTSHAIPSNYQLRKKVAENNILSVVNLPLIVEENCLGTLDIGAFKVDAFSENEIALLETASSHLAIAINNAKIHEGLRKANEEIRSTQQQLIQAEKHSAVGQLISGVAHELNNPLSVILGYAQLMSLRSNEEESEECETIIRNVERCRKITDNLLSFAREEAPEKKNISINNCIEQVLGIVSYHLTTDNIKVKFDFDNELPDTMADEVQLQQVLLNLIGNAHHAISEKGSPGKISISTKHVDDNIVVSIIDDGLGMDQKTLQKAFDPFFTTKEVGKGTGLGLSVSLGIIKKHNGYIRINSIQGKGTEVIVSIPVVKQEEKQVETGTPADIKTFSQGKRVLIIDDEKDILSFFKLLFSKYQWETVTTEDGIEALDHIYKSEFDVIICDLKMPGMSGIELYERLSREKPQELNKIIVSTGDTVNEDTARFLKETGVAYVKKPVDIEELSNVISSILSDK